VVTDDLRAVIEELSGCSYDQFFDQWLYHGYHPELEISYSWDEKTRLAKITVRQTQKITDDVVLFNFPVTVRFKGKFGNVDRSIQVKQKEEDFYFPLESAPEIVRFDPSYTLLAKASFKVPAAMLRAQLHEKDDMIGRLLAIEQLAERKDKDSVALLKETLNKDAFYGVRIEAARALRLIHTDEALDALIASTGQSDARAHRAVAANIAGFYRDTAYASALSTAKTEKNPDIVSAAVEGLGGYAKPEVRDTLLKLLNSDSFRNELADSAVRAIRSQDDPAYIQPLRQTLSERATNFTSRGLASGLGTLAYLARNEQNKDSVREFLLGYINDKRDRVQLATINALGTLGDPQALAAVEKFATGSKETPQRKTAEKVVEILRVDRKPADDFKNLRQEVLDLQKTNRALRKDLDDLKKKVEAAETPKGAKKPKPSAQKGK
jgi:aminopeptidase N